MNKYLSFVPVIALASCTHVNRYEGADAALVPVPCDLHLADTANAKKYQPINVQIFEIDDRFTGSGQGCKDRYVYRIQPGHRKIKVVANYWSGDKQMIKYGIVTMSGVLKPAGSYQLQSQFDGTLIIASLIDPTSQQVIAHGETSDIRTQSGKPMLLLPIPVK
jgi:hypothetical protein